MSTNEILTLQFGHYSNFVGAHWWNIQESSFTYDPDNPSEVNHDVLFREGLSPKNEVTFTPRLLLVDLKGSLRTLPEEGELYQLPQDIDTSILEVRAQNPQEKIEFQKDLDLGGPSKKIYDLEKVVQTWSDFLYTRFHPRTVNVVKEYQHSDEKTPFDIYPLGVNLWKSEYFSEDFVDKIRNYIEECNNFQGFHILLDSHDGFSGLASSCLEYLKDEYDSKPVLSVPLNPDPFSGDPLKLLTTALCFDSLSEHSSLFTPLSTKNRHFESLSQDGLPYHTSAIIAATLDTITLNHRLKTTPHTLIDVCSTFSSNGRKAAASSLRLPVPLKPNQDLIDYLDKLEGNLSHSVTPNCEINPDESLQLVVLRGIPESRLKRPSHVQTKQREMPAYRCDTVKEMLSYFYECTSYRSKSEVIVSGTGMPVKIPFPGFFREEVGDSVSVLAGLHTGKFVGRVFGGLSEDLEKVKYKRLHQFANEGIENDEFKECFDRILDLRDCYEDNYLI